MCLSGQKEGYEIIALHFDYEQRTQEKEKNVLSNLQGFKSRKILYFRCEFYQRYRGNALTDKSIDIPKMSFA